MDSPGDPFQNYELGLSFYARGDLENSRRHYEAARQLLKPGDGFAAAFFRNYAICLGDLGDYEQALNLIDEGLAYFPDYPDLYFIRGQLCSDLNLLAQARTNFLKCLRFRQSLPEYDVTEGVNGHLALQNLSQVCAREQNFEEAAAYLEQVLRIRPTDGLFARLCLLLQQKGLDGGQVAAYLEDSFHLDRLTIARLLFDLRDDALRADDQQEALQQLENSLHSGTATAGVYCLLGTAYAGLDRHDRAFLYFTQAGRQDPGNDLYAACALEQLASQCLLHITRLLALEEGQAELRRELFKLTSLRHKAQRLISEIGGRKSDAGKRQDARLGMSSGSLEEKSLENGITSNDQYSASVAEVVGRPEAGKKQDEQLDIGASSDTQGSDLTSDLLHPTSTLSLCMIARNESEHIGRCLQSAKDFVDEIIVVDTGSTDDTREIARSFGATVIEAEWQDDFSLARNLSLEQATGDWIIFLDCDEELAPGSGPELRALIRGRRYEAYFAQVSNLMDIDSRLLSPSVRLFRNKIIFRFGGRIHEQIATSIINNYGQQSIGQSRLSIIHHGYNGRQANIQAKIRRNLKLLESMADSEKDGFFYYNLGIEHLRLREREKALECFLAASRLTAANMGYAPILALRITTTLMELNRYRDAVRHLKYYQGFYGDFNDLFLLEAICYLHCGWYSQASACLQRYFTMPPAPAWYPTESNYCGAPAEEYRDWLQGHTIPRDFPGISACIIGRDEADSIRRCIHSVNEIAREVIYVDTGSTDETPAIAFQHGAKVFNIPWPGSFSEARNYALDQASSEWILVLDADEMLPEEDKRQIADLLGNVPPETGGYTLKICTFLGGTLSPANCHFTGSCRLFRRLPAGGGGVRYRGVTGEEVVASLLSSGHAVTAAEITVNHLHYQSEPNKITRKRQWKIDAINQGLQSDPLACHYLLGTELFYAQDFAAAAEHLEACRKLSAMSGTPNFFYYYALSLVDTGDYNGAAGILEEASGLFPDYTDLTYLLAIAHYTLGNADAAETLLRRCLSLGDAPWQKYLASPGTGSFKAMNSLGTILAQRGLVFEAADLLFQAAALPGGFEQALEGIVVLSDKLSVPLEQILENKGLLNSVSLSAASKSSAKMLRFQDSLRYLAMACDQVAREPAPRSFTGITQAVDLLIQAFCRGSTGSWLQRGKQSPSEA